MAKILAALFVLGTLPGCAGTPDWSVFGSHVFGRESAMASHYNFDWQLSGNRDVAPVQVFDDGRKTWLQFAPGQPVPAIFEQRAEGDRPLSYKQEGPYVVLNGVWPELVLRGGHLKSTVRRIPASQPDPAPSALELGAAGVPAAGVPAATAHAVQATTAEMPAITASSPIDAPEPQSIAAVAQVVERHAVALVGPERYEVSPRDLTLRAALSRWAQTAGWTFEAEHWAIDADIPIAGSASFELPFKPAVQELVSATELADRPVQPCFYSNRVLRIVPYAQTCDRSAGTQRS